MFKQSKTSGNWKQMLVVNSLFIYVYSLNTRFLYHSGKEGVRMLLLHLYTMIYGKGKREDDGCKKHACILNQLLKVRPGKLSKRKERASDREALCVIW